MFIAIQISNNVYYLIFILKSTINFEGNKWVHTSVDKNGKQSVVTRYVDDKDQQLIVSHLSYFFLFFFNE